LVGRVDAVIYNAARVQLITDPASSVNVRLQNAATDAMLVGSASGDLYLDMISQDARLETGDIVFTSGLGGGFPSQLIVGQVLNIRSVESALFQQATVQSLVDFSQLRIVLVILNFRPVDISPIVPRLAP
jgi:rod shape-determining protein MreC